MRVKCEMIVGLNPIYNGRLSPTIKVLPAKSDSPSFQYVDRAGKRRSDRDRRSI
jgi:hypothetical protein